MQPKRCQHVGTALDGLLDLLAIRADGLFSALLDLSDDRKAIARGRPRIHRAITSTLELEIALLGDGHRRGLAPVIIKHRHRPSHSLGPMSVTLRLDLDRRTPFTTRISRRIRAFLATTWAAGPAHSPDQLFIRDERHERHRGRARRTLKPLKLGERTRISVQNLAALDGVVVADSRVPIWVDGYVASPRLNGLGRGVPWAPVKGSGLGGTRGQVQTGPPQTAGNQQSGC